MSTSQANSMLTNEMDDMKTIMALKTHALMGKLKENRRYVPVVF